MNSPPSDQVAFYIKDLRTDLRFSISKFIRNLLDYYGLCPAQLTPNSIWLIISLLCCVGSYRLSLILLFFEFSLLFDLILRSKVDDFSTRKKVFLSSSVFHRPFRDRRTIFFFISSSLPCGFPSCWGDPRTGPNENNQVEVDDRKIFTDWRI